MSGGDMNISPKTLHILVERIIVTIDWEQISDPNVNRLAQKGASLAQLGVTQTREKDADFLAASAWFQFYIGEKAMALDLAYKALRQDQYHLRAALVLFLGAIEDIVHFQPYINDSSLTLTLITSGLTVYKNKQKVNTLCDRGKQLLEAFDKQYKSNQLTGHQYLSMAEYLVTEVADIFVKLKKKQLACDIYETILQLNWDRHIQEIGRKTVAEFLLETKGRLEIVRY
jgi:tetratricopeptide (TPR) repeat protein